MGWGSHGGLAEHLSFALGRPLDRLSRNDAGASASRRMLVDALIQNPDRLKDKQIVIWQFAERELAVGNWELLSLPLPPTTQAKPAESVLSEDTRTLTETVSPPDFNDIVNKARSERAAVVRGKEDWIFMFSELQHLTRPAFWGKDSPSVDQDPLYSLVDLNKKLDEMGIQLILCPVPARAMIYPDKLFDHIPTDEYGIPKRSDTLLQDFYQALRDQGVTVVDVTDAFLDARREPQHGPVCCEQDSHWSPRGLLIAARAVAAVCKQNDSLQAPVSPAFTIQEPQPIEYVGDLVRLIPGHQDTQSKTVIRRVTEGSSSTERIRFDTDSPVLLLSDSHGLIFSTGGDMHSTAAGFGEQLSAELGFPIDVMARRGGSGDQMRKDLARRFIRKPEYAAKKRILIYTFASRTLTESRGWKIVPLKR